MIDIPTLTADDRGRIVKVYGDELVSHQKPVLANWNEKYLFLAWPDTCPPEGGHISPECVEFTDERATLERTSGGVVWRLAGAEAERG